jgi:quercetin dioxygenase-like cupin family protein
MNVEEQGVARPSVIVEPAAGRSVQIGGMGVDFKVWGETTGGRLAIVEHPMDAGRLVPPHVHHDEDEISYVLEGTFGVRVGDEIGTAAAGSYVFKPRGVPHTFWNSGPGPARLIEILCPAGFERFFEALGALVESVTDPAELDTRRVELGDRYHLDFLPEWIPELKQRFNLKVLGEP